MSTTRTRFGRTRSGRSPWPGALAIGATLTGLVAALTATMNTAGPRSWLLPLILSVLCLPVLTMLGWVLLVDRRTLKGATARPEESVESRWYDMAAKDCFHDLLAVVGLSSMAVSVVPPWHGVLARDVLAWLLLFIAIDVVIRCQLAKRRDA